MNQGRMSAIRTVHFSLLVLLLVEVVTVDASGRILFLSGVFSYSIFVATVISGVSTSLLLLFRDAKSWPVYLVSLFAYALFIFPMFLGR